MNQEEYGKHYVYAGALCDCRWCITLYNWTSSSSVDYTALFHPTIILATVAWDRPQSREIRIRALIAYAILFSRADLSISKNTRRTHDFSLGSSAGLRISSNLAKFHLLESSPEIGRRHCVEFGNMTTVVGAIADHRFLEFIWSRLYCKVEKNETNVHLTNWVVQQGIQFVSDILTPPVSATSH